MKIAGQHQFDTVDQEWMTVTGVTGEPYQAQDQAGEYHTAKIKVRSMRSPQIKGDVMRFHRQHKRALQDPALQEDHAEEITRRFCRESLIADTKGFIDQETGQEAPWGEELLGCILAEKSILVQVLEFASNPANFAAQETQVDLGKPES